MTAAALRAATDAAQQQWAAAVVRVAARWATEASSVESPEQAYVLLRHMLAREVPAAAARGTSSVERILEAAGVSPRRGARAEVEPPRDLLRTVVTAWRATEAHEDPVRARRAVTQRIVDSSLTDAWRDGTHAALVHEPSVIGWRPVARPGCCGACLARADGRIRPLTERLWEHPRGRCYQEPVVRGVNDRDAGRPTGRERWDAMTVAEQDEMFAGHGGRAKADLIRSGEVDLDDLVAWAPRDPSEPNHRQLPREATLRELQLDPDERAALTHRTGIEFGVDAPDAPTLADPAAFDEAFGAQTAWLRRDPQRGRLLDWQATDRTYEEIQAAMRAGAQPSPDATATINTLAEAMARGALPHRTTLWRGVRSLERTFGTADPDELLGEHVLDGFVATSIARDVAVEEFTGARGALLELDVPQDTPAVWVAGAGDDRLRRQGELLLAHGTRLRVVAVRRDGDLTVLSCEVT